MMVLTRRVMMQALGLGPALRVGGKGMVVQGLYQLPNDPEPWKRASEAGFQVVHLPARREEYDRARAHGMYGWSSVGSVAKPEDEARIRKVVDSLKDHPALLYWETEDEPSYQWKKPGPRVPPEAIRATYRLLKSIDPSHPVYLNHAPTNLVSTLRQYNPGGDIIATDIYPVIPHGIREQYALWSDGRQGDLLNNFISQVGQYADKMRQVAGPERAVFMVLQAFAWENLREKDRDPKMVLYPTRAQMRFMAYQSIVHGASGILWWGLRYTPPEAPLWDDLSSIAREIRALSAELAVPPATLPLRLEYHDTGHSLDRGIEWCARPSRGGVLLIAVNADCNPVEAAFSPPERFRRAEGLFGASSSAAPWRERFAPFDVRVWRLPS